MLFGVVSNGIQPCMAIGCYTVVIHETQPTHTSKSIKFVCSIGNKNSFDGFIGLLVLFCLSFFSFGCLFALFDVEGIEFPSTEYLSCIRK